MKDKWWFDRSRELQTAADTKNAKKFFSELKSVYGPPSKGTSPLFDLDGHTVIKEPTPITEKWAQRFNQLLNPQSTISEHAIAEVPQRPVIKELDKPPTVNETNKAMTELTRLFREIWAEAVSVHSLDLSVSGCSIVVRYLDSWYVGEPQKETIGRIGKPDKVFISFEGENSIPPGSPSLRKLTVTFLASEWRSSRDGLSDIKRELAENMAKDPKVQVIFFVPKCDDEDKEEAKIQGVQLVEAGNNPVCDGLTCLNFLPVNSPIDVVVGHGIELAGPAQFIKWLHKCKWVQIVHEAHEEIGVFKECSNPITNAQKKHELEVKLCKESDFVVTIGPKLTETFRRSCEKDECFFEFTPGILAEFSGLKQDLKERKIFRVLCFVCGDPEDFKLKGLDIVAGAVAKLNDCHLVFVSLVDDKLKFKLEDTKQRLLECGLPHYQLRLRGLLDCRRSLEKELLEADLAVMPSRVEGFGVIGLQALSAGLPILVGRNSGLGEALMKVKFGSFFVVDSEDPEVWAKAIKNACHKDRTMRLQECEMLRELYKEVYSWEEQIESLINKFNKLIINSPSEAHYEDIGDSVRLSTVANELKGLVKDYSDIEGVVKGYLSGSPSRNSTLNGSRTTPTGQFAIKDQPEWLEEEISKREQELKQVVDIVEKTYEECHKKLEERLSKEQLAKDEYLGGKKVVVDRP
ncbi:D-inositol 3-phosphate glycosyltransferase [Stylophora pistillata]|uniref:D-inositol 3-phosphate glycosyltransferase n=1 Tax=Stylophora pistillata TaxID=50429 RepID=A0A2B4SIP7_STYPI|nr:D-inositol 3-phosphate glycosyltransferase [Stylophora pistillata]